MDGQKSTDSHQETAAYDAHGIADGDQIPGQPNQWTDVAGKKDIPQSFAYGWLDKVKARLGIGQRRTSPVTT